MKISSLLAVGWRIVRRGSELLGWCTMAYLAFVNTPLYHGAQPKLRYGEIVSNCPRPDSEGMYHGNLEVPIVNDSPYPAKDVHIGVLMLNGKPPEVDSEVEVNLVSCNGWVATYKLPLVPARHTTVVRFCEKMPELCPVPGSISLDTQYLYTPIVGSVFCETGPAIHDEHLDQDRTELAERDIRRKGLVRR